VTILALDLGERRIGVAASDSLGVTARPLQVITCETLARDIARIGEAAAARGATKIVVGLPLNMDGSAGPAARRARRFARRLSRELGIEVDMWDERLSTVQAERALIAADRSRASRREVRDGVAAAVLLQSYLDAQRRSEKT
jgi:putative Holliday junction resolvase